jgi:hypothetical protein
MQPNNPCPEGPRATGRQALIMNIHFVLDSYAMRYLGSVVPQGGTKGDVLCALRFSA